MPSRTFPLPLCHTFFHSALSDQLYGFPEQHAQLRQEICDYLATSPERFAGFVDIEKPFDDYVQVMRQNGTYGGHLELSAFASLKRKEIKIVQPGLVYRVTGHDDSPEAIAEREALEKNRHAIQSRTPSGSERPPASAREIRRRKRIEGRASKGSITSNGDVVEGGPSIPCSDPQTEESDATDHPIEAYGPLYIAWVSRHSNERLTSMTDIRAGLPRYHNWEHYSSVRNVDGPHAGLPRIKEENVAIAAAQNSSASAKGKGRATDDEDASEDNEEYSSKSTEHEELILRSVPGHTLKEVRSLLRQHGNLWETVVEVLIAQDAKEAEQRGAHVGSPLAADGARRTRSGGASQTYLNGRSASSLAVSSPNQHRALLPVPERVREAHGSFASNGVWRDGSPASSSGGDATSASTHATTMTNSSSAEDGTSVATTMDAPSSMSPETERGNGSKGGGLSSGGTITGTKRAASVDAMSGVDGAKSPKRRSSSREREQEEQSVDGALASGLDTVVNEVRAQLAQGESETDSFSSATLQQDFGAASDFPRAASLSALSTPIDSDSPSAAQPSTASPSLPPYTSTTYTYPLESSRGRLSPPLSPSLLSRDDLRNLSAREKREIELKRKRDRQRQRRAQARQTKEHRNSRAKGATTAAAASKGPSDEGRIPSATKGSAEVARRRQEQTNEERREQRQHHTLQQRRKTPLDGHSGSVNGDIPQGFVELKI